MKNSSIHYLFYLVMFMSLNIQAQEMHPMVFLNKLSERLVQKAATPEEYEKLNSEMQKKNCSSTVCLENYFRKYIQDKMNSDDFYAIFYSHVTERFGYKTPRSLNLEKLFYTKYPDNGASAGRDFALVYRTLKENRSFDELYTSQMITEPESHVDLNKHSGAMEYISIDTEGMRNNPNTSSPYLIELKNNKQIQAQQFDLTGHNNYSGLFTSSIFLNHRWNTDLNQNRKRAAAYYRIMLCDMMTPALDRESEKQKENRMALGILDENIIRENIKQIHKDKHATQIDCNACHTRLDPVGKVFRAFEQGVSNVSLKGEIKYTDVTDDLKVVEVSNFHDLTLKTVQLPKYFDCQMSWFAEIYLGLDFKLSTARLADVSKQIERRKRKIKDVIEDLLMIPEFRNIKIETVEPESFIQARAVLDNCKDCHSSFFSMRPELLKSKLSKVAVCMDVDNGGKNAQMPPSDHYWHANNQEIEQVRKWLSDGAPVSQSMNLFNQQEVQKIFQYKQEQRKCRK